ncbi:MAG: corrinoid protein [Dehalococcoidia bacterium]|nr:corrinoid protein [Dehalococcoidia bacterium]
MQLDDLKQRLIEGDAKAVATLTQQALDDGTPAQALLTDTLIPGMNVVGELFEKNEYFVPELLLAARAMSAAVEILRPHLAASDFKPTGKAVIGTVQGDLHDIGKKLVIIMLEGNGYEVIDLGVDIPPERFVEAVQESGSRLVGLSALLTTTMPAMEKTVKALKDADPSGNVKVIVGGAPVTQAFADSIGADGYGRDATAAVTLARQLLGDG